MARHHRHGAKLGGNPNIRPLAPNPPPHRRPLCLSRGVSRSGPRQRGPAGGCFRCGTHSAGVVACLPALGGDDSDQRLQGDYSGYPEAIRMFADTLLALHHHRLLADEDPSASFTAAEAQAWVERATDAINAFLSDDPMQRRSFALEILLRPPGAQEPAD